MAGFIRVRGAIVETILSALRARTAAMRAEEASDEEIERDPTCLLFLSRLRRYASQTLADHDDELKYPKTYREFVPGDAGIANRFVDAMRIAPAGHRTKLTCLVHAASVFHPAIERALVEPLLAGLLRLKIPAEAWPDVRDSFGWRGASSPAKWFAKDARDDTWRAGRIDRTVRPYAAALVSVLETAGMKPGRNEVRLDVIDTVAAAMAAKIVPARDFAVLVSFIHDVEEDILGRDAGEAAVLVRVILGASLANDDPETADVFAGDELVRGDSDDPDAREASRKRAQRAAIFEMIERVLQNDDVAHALVRAIAADVSTRTRRSEAEMWARATSGASEGSGSGSGSGSGAKQGSGSRDGAPKTKAEKKAAAREAAREAAEKEADARELAAISAIVGKTGLRNRRRTRRRRTRRRGRRRVATDPKRLRCVRPRRLSPTTCTWPPWTSRSCYAA